MKQFVSHNNNKGKKDEKAKLKGNKDILECG